MNKKGVLLLQTTTPEQIKLLKAIAPDYEIVDGFTKEIPDFPLDDIEILYGWNGKIGNTILHSPSSKLKWVQMHTAGVDFVDQSLMKEKHIILTNSSGLHGKVISESVFGMLLSYTRGIIGAIKDQPLKKWGDRRNIMELQNSTMMIVGAGRIGIEVAKLAKAFGMKTVGVNRTGKAVEHMDVIIKQSDFINHVEEADVVVNILPLTTLTTYFFDRTIFSRMKKTAVFINVGRGKSVNTVDLVEALEQGQLAFAALDVFETEPLPADNPLWEREDVLITPHISGLLPKFNSRLFTIFEENLRAYVEGRELPRNLIDFERSY
jgi:phosphoglycerate dehydrogenase-like enzyme